MNLSPASAYLGLDLGTSGVRATAIADDETEIASSAVSLPPPVRNEAGHSEQNPELWWEAVAAVLRDLSGKLDGYAPHCLAVDGTSSTLLLCDADGLPLTPALMYDDTRSRGVLPAIRAVAPAESAVHSASSSLAKLLQLYPSLAARPGLRALHQADWILGRLSGRFGVSDEHNVLKLGYDAVARTWPAWLGRFGFPLSLLPEVRPAGTPVDRVSQEAVLATGLPETCAIATGTTDSTAAAFASGIVLPGEAVTSLGSTLVVKVLSEHPIFVPEFGVYSHRLGDLWLAGGASNTGGAVLAHYFTDEEMARLSAAIDPSQPSGLDYYPLLKSGERFPVDDPDLPPRVNPRPAEDVRFFQGLLEGMAAIERRGYERLAELGAPYPSRVLTLGGGARNEAWRSIRRRCLGVPVETVAHRSAAHGTARLARLASL